MPVLALALAAARSHGGARAGSGRVEARSCRPVCSAAVPDLASERWLPLKKRLDELPVFTCANEKGDPVNYERDGKPLTIFFADVVRAQQEVLEVRKRYPDQGLKLRTAGLGGVFQAVCNGESLPKLDRTLS